MIEILDVKLNDHSQIIKALNYFTDEAVTNMCCDATYDIDMDTEVITISVTLFQLSYRFKGELHCLTMFDEVTNYGVKRAGQRLYSTVRRLIINEIYLKIFGKDVDTD